MTLQEVFKMIEIEAECTGIGLAHEGSPSELDSRSDGGDPPDARDDDIGIAQLSRS